MIKINDVQYNELAINHRKRVGIAAKLDVFLSRELPKMKAGEKFTIPVADFLGEGNTECHYYAGYKLINSKYASVIDQRWIFTDKHANASTLVIAVK